FVLPTLVMNDKHRGVYSLLADVEPVYPPPQEAEDDEWPEDWSYREDWQVVRNPHAFARSWVVHDVRFVPPITGFDRKDREPVMTELLYPGDALWNEPGRAPLNPAETVWIESDPGAALQEFAPGGPPAPSEAPEITRYEPQRVEIDVTMERPGILVLADVY